MGTSLRGRGAPPVTAVRRRRAPSGAGPLKPTSARSGGTPLATATAPSGGLALLPAEADREARRAAEWVGPPVFWDGHLFCGHDARVPRTSTCAAGFFWHEFRNTRLPCGHQPKDTRPMTCDVCRFYLEGLDERRGRPRRLDCGQPAAVPILWGACACCIRAGHTHGSLDLLFCGHTLERPGLNCPSCQARRNLNDAEGGVHMLHTRRFHGGATASNRVWSPPNRYDVMTGSFGPMDDSLEAELRAQWLDAVEKVTGFDPRQLRRRDFDRDRRRSRAIEHGVGPGSVGGGPGQARAPRSQGKEQGGRWVRDTHRRFGERDGRGERGASRLGARSPRWERVGGRDARPRRQSAAGRLRSPEGRWRKYPGSG